MPNAQLQKKLSLKSYLLIGIIGALVITNGLLFYQNQHEKSEISSQNLFQNQALQSEIAHLEEQLNASEMISKSLEKGLLKERSEAKSKLYAIRTDLTKHQTNKTELEAARSEIVKLRSFVKRYQLQIDSLEKVNERLSEHNQKLNLKISHADEKIARLNKTLIKGRFLYLQHLEATALKKRFGISSPTEKASRVVKLQIQFEVLPNILLEKGKYPFYIRIFDPLGNLIADDKDVFKLNEETLQYSFMSHIDFQNESSKVVLLWNNPHNFEKGKYSILVYAQNRVIAETEILLK